MVIVKRIPAETTATWFDLYWLFSYILNEISRFTRIRSVVISYWAFKVFGITLRLLEEKKRDKSNRNIRRSDNVYPTPRLSEERRIKATEILDERIMC